MRTKLVALLTAFIMIFGVAPALAAPAPVQASYTAAESVESTDRTVAPTIFRTRGVNNVLSNRVATFATGKNGAGTWSYVHPGQSTSNIQSVWAPSGCLVLVNNIPRRSGQWINKAIYNTALVVFINC